MSSNKNESFTLLLVWIGGITLSHLVMTPFVGFLIINWAALCLAGVLTYFLSLTIR